VKRSVTRHQAIIRHEHEKLVRLSRAFGHVYATDDGRLVLDYIVQQLCRTDQPGVHDNPLQTYHRLGKRDVGLAVMRLIEGVTQEPEIDNE